MALRLVFMGTPEFAVPTLRALAGAGHAIVAVYSREAKPSGRGMKLQPTPVAREAERLGAPVFAPRTLKVDAAQHLFASHAADAAIVVAYGLILPQPILNAPRHGCYNLHASLLPRWRGAAPINRAIMAGDEASGVAIMKMDAGLDTGPVALTERVPIDDGDTASDLHDALCVRGAALMVDAMAALEAGTLALTPQPERGVTYAAKIDKAEAHIDFARPAREVLRHCHGLSPFPGAWCDAALEAEIVRLKILRCAVVDGQGTPGELLDNGLTIACGSGAIRATHLQRAGKAPMSADEFLRGTPLARGLRLT
jgi:methionyl-tRNA formyltransferase